MADKTVFSNDIKLTAILLFLSFILNNTSGSTHLEFEISSNDAVLRGERALESFESRSLSSRSGKTCWRSALNELTTQCKAMDEEDQRLIGLRFANCHLEMSGLDTFPCTKDNFKMCTKKMAEISPLSFSTYTEFFSKVFDICHYLKSDMWMERTQNLVSELSKTSEDVVEKLIESSEKQDLLLSVQHLSIENQKTILQNGKDIHDTVVSSARSAAEEFKKAKKRSEEKSKWLDESFNKIFNYLNQITRIFDTMSNNLSIVHSTGFYVFSLFFWIFACSSPSVANARYNVCAILFIACFVEIIVPQSPLKSMLNDYKTWQLRGISYFFCFAITFYYWIRYLTANVSNPEIAKLQRLVERMELLGEKNGPHEVSKVQKHWIKDRPTFSKDWVDRGPLHFNISQDSSIFNQSIIPMDSSTPRKNLKNTSIADHLEDSGISSDKGIQRTAIANAKNKKSTPRTIGKRKSTILQRLGVDSIDIDSSNPATLSSYNLRSRSKLIP